MSDVVWPTPGRIIRVWIDKAWYPAIAVRRKYGDAVVLEACAFLPHPVPGEFRAKDDPSFDVGRMPLNNYWDWPEQPKP